MTGKFGAVVGSDSNDHVFEWQKLFANGIRDHFSRTNRDFLEDAKAGTSLDERNNRLLLPPSDDGIGFPVAEP